jgi:mono/diheme cytochrome c family protein
MRRIAKAFVAVAVLSLPACWQKMGVQPSYRPLQPSDFFIDGRSSRAPVPGTVARGQLRIDAALYQGKDDKGEPVAEFPFEVTKDVLERGKRSYGVYCSVCHGPSGKGDGRIVQRGFTVPPSYLDDSRAYALKGKKINLKDVPHGHIFDVATRGFGAMPDYAEQVRVDDRWAIVAYIRALQASGAPAVKEKGR